MANRIAVTPSAPDEHAESVSGTAPAPMLLDRLQPECDAARVEHRIVPGDLAEVYAAVRGADFLRAWRETPAVRVLFATRAAAERLIATARGRPAPAVDEEPASMRLADMPSRGEWVLLGECAPFEIAFGAIGRFWAGETAWEEIEAEQFATFDRPGYGKIACNLSLRPYGESRTLVTYECRTRATDEASRRAFLRYWRPLSPFIGVVMRALLRIVAQDAQRAPRRA